MGRVIGVTAWVRVRVRVRSGRVGKWVGGWVVGWASMRVFVCVREWACECGWVRE